MKPNQEVKYDISTYIHSLPSVHLFNRLLIPTANHVVVKTTCCSSNWATRTGRKGRKGISVTNVDGCWCQTGRSEWSRIVTYNRLQRIDLKKRKCPKRGSAVHENRSKV